VRERSDTCMYHSDADADADVDDADNDADGNGNGCRPGSTTDNKESGSLLSKICATKVAQEKRYYLMMPPDNNNGDGNGIAFGGGWRCGRQ
jgi:hypothetical protein